MRRFLLIMLIASACSSRMSPPSITIDDDPVDAHVAADFGASDTRIGPVLPERPTIPDGFRSAAWIDVHMHCIEDPNATDLACATDWDHPDLAAGRGVLLSTAHWKLSIPPEIAPTDGLNDVYAAAEGDDFVWFASLDCWHDTPFGPGWADACKTDAIAAIEQGALGFKDHAGKQFESTDNGLFVGALNRAAGRCEPDPDSMTPNADCMLEEGVFYPALEPEYREVVRFIVEELRVPLVTHLSSWNGGDTECYNPISATLERCAAAGREHQQLFAEWAEQTLGLEDRRRIIIAHLGFLVDDPDALRAMLDTGVSLDTSRPAVAQAGCDGRVLFAEYPDQLVFGTDRRPGESCNPPSYRMYLHGFTAAVDDVRTFNACPGTFEATGMDLDEPSVPGCADVPADAADRVLKTNFLRMYD